MATISSWLSVLAKYSYWLWFQVQEYYFHDLPNTLKKVLIPMTWPTQNNIELNEISCDSIFWPWLVQLILGWRGWKFNEPSHNYILSIFLFYFTIHVFRDLPKIAKSKRIVKRTLMTKFSYLFTMYPSKEKSHRNLPSRKNFQRTRMKRTTIIVLCWVLSIMV